MVQEVHLRSSSPLYLLQPEAPGRASRSQPSTAQTPFLQSFPPLHLQESHPLSVCPSVPCSSLRHLYLRTTFSLAFPALSESPALAELCSSAYTSTPQGRGTPTPTHGLNSLWPHQGLAHNLTQPRYPGRPRNG